MLNEDEAVQSLLSKDNCNIEDEEEPDLEKSSNLINNSEAGAMFS